MAKKANDSNIEAIEQRDAFRLAFEASQRKIEILNKELKKSQSGPFLTLNDLVLGKVIQGGTYPYNSGLRHLCSKCKQPYDVPVTAAINNIQLCDACKANI